MELSEFLSIFELVSIFNVAPEKPIAIDSLDSQKVNFKKLLNLIKSRMARYSR